MNNTEHSSKKRTSSAAKFRYNKKTYGRISAFIPKEIADAFKAKCAENGIPQSQIIRKAIDDFLAE